MVKRSLFFFCLFLLVFSSQAKSHAVENIDKEGPTQALEPTEEGTVNYSIDQKNAATQKTTQVEETVNGGKEAETDSSYYSVNKFNILFYFMYKLKYGEEDPSIQE